MVKKFIIELTTNPIPKDTNGNKVGRSESNRSGDWDAFIWSRQKFLSQICMVSRRHKV